MSCKSALYAVNTNNQVLTANSNINMGSIVRKFGCDINVSGGNVVINGTGYYDIIANFDVVATVVGTPTITLYKDGVAIPGASASITVATGDNYSVTIPCIIRDTCCCESTITAILSGENLTINTASIKVERI